MSLGEIAEVEPCPFCGACDATLKRATTREWGSFVETQGTKWGAYQCGCTARGPEVRTGYGSLDEWAPAAIEEWNRRVTAVTEAILDVVESEDE